MLELLREAAPILTVLISAAAFLLIYRHGGYAAGYRRGYSDAIEFSQGTFCKKAYEEGRSTGYKEGLKMRSMWERDFLDRERSAILREELAERKDNMDNKE